MIRENEESESDKKKSLQLLLEKANELVNEIQWDKSENKSKEKCQICWQLKELVVIVDCGHFNFCQECLKCKQMSIVSKKNYKNNSGF